MEGHGRDRVVFLSVPESLRGAVAGEVPGGDFHIDPDIPLPVEIPDGGDEDARSALENLSWEMIVSGMLRAVAGGHERSDYYRGLVLALRPSIMAEFTEAATAKARAGDFALALEILDSLRGLFPASPVARLNRALVMESRAAALERRGDPEAEAAFAQAEAAYGEAMSLDPAFPEAWLNAGFFFLGRQDFARARECLSFYADNAPEEDDEAAGKARRARDLVREIDESELDDESLREARALVRDGREEAGLLAARGFVERRPEVWHGWFVLGWALRRLRRWDSAAAAFERAVELGGGNSDTRNELAICLMEAGNLSGARRQLEAALRDDCENAKTVSNLGALALKSGRKGEAAAFFRAALEIDPEDPLTASLLARCAGDEG